jgi:hypothetical protein
MTPEPRRTSRRRFDPEEDRIVPEPAAPFQVRSVEGPGGPQAGTPAPLAQAFQVRTAATVTLPPPHWAKYQATPPSRQEE